jgi:LCP family protein required for cell wall assembly
MSFDPTEILIREALADQANRAVDSQTVLAELRRGKVQTGRRRGPIVVAAAAVVAIVAVGAVVIPRVLHRDGPAVGSPPTATATDQNVLLAGLDKSGNADSIVLAHSGRDGAEAAVSLPRDSWVNVPGYGMHKLGSAYALARTDAIAQGHNQADADEAGARTLTATVRELTGAAVDHYAMVDMTTFDQLSTAVGGVPVCLRAASHDPLSGASFPAGRQTLTGPAVLAFLRQRHGLPGGDLDRIIRLQAYLRSLVHEVLTGPILTDSRGLTTLLDTVRGTVRVDPSWDLLAFAAQLRGVRQDNLRVGTIPVANLQGQGPDGMAVIELAPDQVRSFVQAFTAAEPATTAAPTTNSSSSILPPGEVPCVN